jgi:hypothetical protein
MPRVYGHRFVWTENQQDSLFFEEPYFNQPLSLKHIYWIAAFLEGEGSFLNQSGMTGRVAATQKHLHPLKRLQGLCGGSVSKPNARGISTWFLSGSRAVGLMMTIFPLMSPRRKAQILGVLQKWKARPPQNVYKTHCKRGHPLTPENVYYKKPQGRECIPCRRFWGSKRRTLSRRKSFT